MTSCHEYAEDDERGHLTIFDNYRLINQQVSAHFIARDIFEILIFSSALVKSLLER